MHTIMYQIPRTLCCNINCPLRELLVSALQIESKRLILKSCRTVSTQSSASSPPSKKYKEKIASKEINVDKHQEDIVNELDKVFYSIQNYKPKTKSIFSVFKQNVQQPKGLYIYGAVGGGKTMLMDIFYDSCETDMKQRVHFNKFMLDVHAKIHEVKQILAQQKSKSYDPIPPVANDIIAKTWLICFDEFQVTDIADAMILKRLFTELFHLGVIVIATSNRAPEELYKNGLQRSNFVPFIDVLKNYCNVLSLNSNIDYRSVKSMSSESDTKTYFVRNSINEKKVSVIFKSLSAQENDIVRPRVITILGRNVTFNKTCGQILETTFDELCNRDLGPNDYLHICQIFHTVFVRGIPQLNIKLRSQTRRFITLIDALYDNNIRIVLMSDVPLNKLFSNEESVNQHSDEHRMLMDDLNIRANDHNDDNTRANIFTGEEELFAFDRTISRITEMQTSEYWYKPRGQ